MTPAPILVLDPADALPEGTVTLSTVENVLALAGPLPDSIALQFPTWTDGRAYSQAVLLRGRRRWRGELFAVGDVLADMLPLLRRCGFDAVRLRRDQKFEWAQRALGTPDAAVPYQRSLHAHARRQRADVAV